MASEDVLAEADYWLDGSFAEAELDLKTATKLARGLAAEICELRSEVSVWKARSTGNLLRAEDAEKRPTPTLAEVASRVAAGMLMNPVNDTVSMERFVRSACDIAEALLAELERRGK